MTTTPQDRQKTRGVLYHCIPVAPVGDVIRPSDKYGATISENVRRQLGMPPEVHTPLVFAATDITKAMAFGLQGNLQEKILNSSIEGSNGELVLACDREKLMARARNITIYEISNEGFAPLEHAERQCVSTKPIAFSEAKIVFQAKRAEDLMQGGLQILAFNESFKELNGYDFVEKTMKERGYKTFDQFLGDMVQEGKIIWENQARGINPDPVLAQKIGVELKMPRPPIASGPNRYAELKIKAQQSGTASAPQKRLGAPALAP